MRSAWNAVIAEIGGTFFFFFVGIGAVAALDRAAYGGAALDPAAGLIVVALAHGIVLAVLVSALGAISGAHFNPAVTFGVWLAGRMPEQACAGLCHCPAHRRAFWPRSRCAWSFPPRPRPDLGTPALGIAIDPLGGCWSRLS